MPEQTSSRQQIAIYLLLVFAFSSIFYFPVLKAHTLGPGAGLYVSGIMWCPALAAITTLKLNGRNLTELGWKWPEKKYAIQSWLIPLLYATITYAIVWGGQLGGFPNHDFMDLLVQRMGLRASPTVSTVVYILLAGSFGVIKSLASALGEEIGWRGFLVSELFRNICFTGTALISGVVWACWHYPLLIWSDYNSGTPTWYGLTCFTVLVVSISFVFAWMRLKSGVQRVKPARGDEKSMQQKPRISSGLVRTLLTSAALALTLSIASWRILAEDNAPNIPARKDYAAIVQTLRPFIEREMSEKGLPGLSIAIVDDQQVVWAEGFGMADPHERKPATAATVYRIGSVSKLFTDIAIMQLVERRELNLDAPITDYLPNFRPRNPFGTPITLRQLMSHRSGLLREPPVGNYFETSQPSLAATVRSLNDTELVFAPNTHTKYSNAAIAVVGYLLEARSREPFAKYLKSSVLDRMGLTHSSFEPDPTVISNLAKAQMWTYDGLTFDAPTFQLGMAPAGSMYSTVTDLGHFLSVLMARGQTDNGPLLQPKTIEDMWSPQFPNPGGRVFGLGFIVRSVDGRRLVGHGGTIYGFATTLDLLPEDKVGVVVTATKDSVNAVTERIGEETLKLVLDQRAGKPLTLPQAASAVSAEVGRPLVGRYGTGDDAIDITYLDGRLSLLKLAGGEQLELRQLGEDLIVDGATGYGIKVTPIPDGIRVGPKTLTRLPTPKPGADVAKFQGLIGEYGWDHDILYVFEKGQQLNVLIEWFEFDRLMQISDDVFNFPSRGLYDGEKAVFTRDASGNATQVQVSGVVFKRRPIGGVSGGVFRIPPVKNFADLRKQALADHPPAEAGEFRKADLVELSTLDPTIKLDIRYATTNNFLNTPVYSQARAFLQGPAAEALLRAGKTLKELGYGLLIHDAYRPWYVTKIFWEATPEDKRIFVADPSQGSRHNRGCAVDLSLYALATGKPVEMVGVYDEMSERSYPGYPGGTSLQRWDRELLRRAMEDQGFLVYSFEWWHFDYRDWKNYPILNLTFEQLSPQ